MKTSIKNIAECISQWRRVIFAIFLSASRLSVTVILLVFSEQTIQKVHIFSVCCSWWSSCYITRSKVKVTHLERKCQSRFSRTSSWKVYRFPSNEDQSDRRFILHLYLLLITLAITESNALNRCLLCIHRSLCSGLSPLWALKPNRLCQHLISLVDKLVIAIDQSIFTRWYYRSIQWMTNLITWDNNLDVGILIESRGAKSMQLALEGCRPSVAGTIRRNAVPANLEP